MCRFLATNHFPRQATLIFVMCEENLAANDRVFDSLRPLDQPLLLARQVVAPFRLDRRDPIRANIARSASIPGASRPSLVILMKSASSEVSRRTTSSTVSVCRARTHSLRRESAIRRNYRVGDHPRLVRGVSPHGKGVSHLTSDPLAGRIRSAADGDQPVFQKLHAGSATKPNRARLSGEAV